MALVPVVVNKRVETKGPMIYSRLLKRRIIFLGGEINNVVADLVVLQLLF